MKIGIVGYQGSGKSTLFQWVTGEEADPALAHRCQSAMATVPEPRVEALRKVYSPKKVTLAALEVVDTPGLQRDHEIRITADSTSSAVGASVSSRMCSSVSLLRVSLKWTTPSRSTHV